MSDETRSMILVVDDTPSSVKVVETVLTEAGYQVSVATSGEKALERISVIMPDLILLDIMMPGIDGYETCRRLKENESTRSIPIIFLSALAETFDKVRGFELGGVDYLIKPIAPEELLARIKTHLRLKRLELWLEHQNKLLLIEITEREEAQEELRTLNNDLETRVMERTADLATTNKQLLKEIEVRKQAELALQAKKEELDRFFTFNLILLSITDQQGKILRLNPEWEKILGYPLQEISDHPICHLVHPDDLQKTMDVYAIALNNTITNFINRYRHSDGSYRWLEWSFFPYDNLVYAAARDITRTVTMEQERADLLNQIKKNMAEMAILNDGIRNPLTTIMSYADLLLGDEGVKIIHEVERIDNFITKLDSRWVESEKILLFLQRHHGIEIK